MAPIAYIVLATIACLIVGRHCYRSGRQAGREHGYSDGFSDGVRRGGSREKDAFHREAVSRGYAERDSIVGEFQWKTPARIAAEYIQSTVAKK